MAMDKKTEYKGRVWAFFVTFVCNSPRWPISCRSLCVGCGMPPSGFKTKAKGLPVYLK